MTIWPCWRATRGLRPETPPTIAAASTTPCRCSTCSCNCGGRRRGKQALQTLIEQLHDPKSPNFHHWLNAAEFGAQFGPDPSDIAAVTGWLRQQGFTVNFIYPSGMSIDYSGTAGQVRTAFHTEIHHLSVNGVTHFANMSDPQIPAALAPAVVGIVSLHNFKPKAQHAPKAPQSSFTQGGSIFYLVPERSRDDLQFQSTL